MDISKWQPHRPETWTHRFATLVKPIVMHHFVGREKGEPVYRDVPLEEGSRVKIVMVSRFGDVGITENLDAEYGYGARVGTDYLRDWGIE